VVDPNTNETVAVGGYSCDEVCETWSELCYTALQAGLSFYPTAVPSDITIAAK